ncbi:MAG TPA: hypothetical protein VJ385_02310 [Fibrobacteria bacterium]|nr:hypothetical protein [Fibrobacteria bacterium]
MTEAVAVPKTSKRPDVKAAIEAGEGVLRLAPCWVPRSFLMPGKRLKLHPDDYYALGAHRGGIDERWFASTTEAGNDNRAHDEGLSYVVGNGERFTLLEAVMAEGPTLIGRKMWDKYKRWPVYSKFFDNMGPIPHHMHHNEDQAAKVGQEGKPECYYFPPQLNAIGNNFPHTYFGLEPGVTKEDVRRCLENWNKGDNGILDLSKAYRLKPGTGWHVPACVLHAPGSLLTYEPQWGSDVFAMYQSMVEGRRVEWDLFVKDTPDEFKQDLDYLVDQLDWEGNVDPNFRDHHFLEPINVAETWTEGYQDKWVVYGRFGGPNKGSVRGDRDLFTAKELTLDPGVKVTLKDGGAYGLITMQGVGRVNKHRLESPSMIRFGAMTEDEVFVSHEAATQGVTFENTGTEPLVTLRYFGPDCSPDSPHTGAFKNLRK